MWTLFLSALVAFEDDCQLHCAIGFKLVQALKRRRRWGWWLGYVLFLVMNIVFTGLFYRQEIENVIQERIFLHRLDDIKPVIIEDCRATLGTRF